MDSDKNCCKVYIGGDLPHHIHEEQIYRHLRENRFDDHDVEINLPRDAAGKLKGYAFVTFASKDIAKNAVCTLDGTSIRGRHKIKVKPFTSFRSVPLKCPPEHQKYIELMLVSKKQKKALISSLSAKISFQKGKIIFDGDQESVRHSQEKVKRKFLSNLLHQKFTFTCETKYTSNVCSILKKHILNDMKRHLQYVYHMDTQSRKQNCSCVSVLILSQNADHFSEICAEMEVAQPHSGCYSLKCGSLQLLCGRLDEMKEKHQTDITTIPKSEQIIIHSLTKDEGEECWREIEDIINSELIVNSVLPLSYLQAKYLDANYKDELEGIKKEGIVLTMPQPKGQNELLMKGTVNQIAAAELKLKSWAEIGYKEYQFDVEVPLPYASMWRKRWQQIKCKEESTHKVIIEFEQKRLSVSSNNGTDSVPGTLTITFMMGGDSCAIGDIKASICTKECGGCIAQQPMQLPPGGASVIRKGLDEKKVDIDALPVQVDIDEHLNHVTILSPQGALKDLIKAEDILCSFVNNQTETISLSDPIVGLILTSPNYSSKMNSITQPLKVQVSTSKFGCKNLTLTGNQPAIEQAKVGIQELLKCVGQDISQKTIEVELHHDSVVESKEFGRFCELLQNELYVTCTHKYKKLNKKALQPIMVQHSKSPNCVKLQIVVGSIINERVDAVVNNSNENLQHSEGLSKTILDTGGPAIQHESDEYVQAHGKLKPGDAICLGAGSLLCNRLIHVVWPQWEDTKPSKELISAYCNTIIKILSLAEEEKMNSVALSEVLGIPSNVFIPAVFEALKTFCCSSIHKIHYVLPDTSSSMCEFLSALKLQYPEHFKQPEKKELPAVTEDKAGGQKEEPSNRSDSSWSTYFSNLYSALLGGKRPVAAQKKSKEQKTETRKGGMNNGTATNGKWRQEGQGQQWLWQDDRGSFQPYSISICSMLSQEYAKDSKGSTSFSLEEHNYSVSFSTMTQTNVATKKQRKIQHRMSMHTPAPLLPVADPLGLPQWLYEDDDGQFRPYTPNDAARIQIMYECENPSVLQINGKSYTFDFSTLSQINVATKRRRQIKQQKIENTEATCFIIDQNSDQTVITLSLRGLKGNLEAARSRVMDMLSEDAHVVHDVPIPPGIQSQLERKLEEITKKYKQVTTSIVSDAQTSKVLKIKGPRNAALKVVNDCQKEIICCQKLQDFPSEWQPQTDITQLFPLTQGTQEWIRVSDMFYRTMSRSTNRIISINRIQNKYLWGRYTAEKDRLKLKNAGVVNEMELFHGTRTNDPKLIYKGEYGFDMRYSAEGMWGKANYFAVNASYSDSYAHIVSWPRRKEMFLVKVLTGNSSTCSPDRSLHMPPINSSIQMAKGSLQLEQPRYDTVTGTTQKCQVFMTYDNDKAYPAYLITY